IQKNTKELCDFAPYDVEDVDRAVPAFSGVEYYDVHKHRFTEMINFLAFAQSKRASPLNILECGSSLTTKLIKCLLPQTDVSIVDFSDMEELEAFSIFPLRDLIKKHYKIDLMRDKIDEINLEVDPQFDVILLCEVIEHLLVNPHKVIRFLLRQLKKSGY